MTGWMTVSPSAVELVCHTGQHYYESVLTKLGKVWQCARCQHIKSFGES